MKIGFMTVFGKTWRNPHPARLVPTSQNVMRVWSLCWIILGMVFTAFMQMDVVISIKFCVLPATNLESQIKFNVICGPL
jgi:hypothetical protein